MKIAMLTSGGDAPGMNAVLYDYYVGAKKLGHDVVTVKEGYKGLILNQFEKIDEKLLEENSKKAGTVIKSSRCPEFQTEKGVKKAVKNILKNKIDLMLIIGGEGSFRGAKELVEQGIKVTFIPATIDNDMQETEYTMGFDTAIFSATDCIEKVMNTMTAFNRSAIFTVMGRHCPYLANAVFDQVGDYKITVSEPLNIGKLVKDIKKNKKESLVIILQERLLDAKKLGFELMDKTKRMYRAVEIGYIQRGTDPTKSELKKAREFASLALMLLKTHIYNKVVVVKNKKFDYLPIN